MWQKSLHIALMLLVYLSSTSLMISKHYCSDQLMGTSFMTEAESCHKSEVAKKTCPNHPENNTTKKDCCSSEFQLIKTEFNYDLYQPQIKTFQIEEILPVLVFVFLKNESIDPKHQSFFADDFWDPPSTSAVYLPRTQQFLC